MLRITRYLRITWHISNIILFLLPSACGDINVESSEAAKSVFYIERQLIPHFVKRPNILEEVNKAFEKNINQLKLVTLCGLGGMGKSQIALDFCLQNKEFYQYIFWMEADTETTLQSSFIAAARKLKLADNVDQPEKIVRDMIEWLQETSGWLVVFDNADDYSLNKTSQSFQLRKKYFPKSGQGDILITTCLKYEIGQDNSIVDLDKMEMDDSTALKLLLRERVEKYRDDQSALEIVRILGYLPLALDLAGAYMEMDGSSPTKCLELYKTDAEEFLHPHEHLQVRRCTEYRKTVFTVWRTSFQLIKDGERPLAINLIQSIALLYPDNIPLELFEHHAQKIYELDSAINPKSLKVDAQILIDFSFVRRNENDSEKYILTVHRLVQKFILFEMESPKKLELCKRLLSAISQELKRYDDASRVMKIYAPHIRHLIDQIMLLAINKHDIIEFSKWVASQTEFSKELMPILSPTVFYLTSRHLLEGVENLATLSILVSKAINGVRHEDTATALSNLSYFYMNQRQLKRAERPCTLAWKIRRMVLGQRDKDTISAVHELAFLYSKLDEERLATQMYWEAATVDDYDAQIELIYRYQDGIKAPKHVGLAHSWKCRLKEFPKLLAAQQFSKSSENVRRDFTPLHLAVQHSDIERITIEYKQFAKSRDRNGRTALHLAAKNGNSSLALIMVNDFSIKTSVEDNYGQTPLHLAAESGHLEVTRLLVNDFDSNINAKDKDGHLPLYLAVRNQHKDVVKLLLKKYGAHLNLKGTYVH